MKLTQLFQASLDAARQAKNLLFNAPELMRQETSRRVQSVAEQTDVPMLGSRRTAVQEADGMEPNRRATDRQESDGWETDSRRVVYRSSSPATDQATSQPPHGALETDPQTAPLKSGIKLSGRRGSYQIDKLYPAIESHLESTPFLHRYGGFWEANNTPVRIREFGLTDLNHAEAANRRLEHLESVILRRTGVQDFRLIAPWDTFVDLDRNRGYLITRSPLEKGKLVSLREHLRRWGAMSAEQVRHILSQVLQTLWFLHTHTIRFADGTTQQGLVHGNLNLDSLQIPEQNRPDTAYSSSFFVYATDLALWENAFQPPTKKSKGAARTIGSETVPSAEAIHSDLQSLGVVAYRLLVEDLEPKPILEVDPEQHPRWSSIPDRSLKEFILDLIDQPFDSAKEAYEVLRQQPVETVFHPDTAPPDAIESAAPSLLEILPAILLLLLLIGGLIGIGVWLMRSLLKHVVLEVPPWSQPASPSGFKDVTFPAGNFSYGVSETWRDVLAPGRAAFGQRLTEVWGDRDSDLDLLRYAPNYQFRDTNISRLLRQFQSKQLTFALTRWYGNGNDGNDLNGNDPNNNPALNFCKTDQDIDCWVQDIIAYDGVVVFVAFSDPQRPQNIPKVLQGKLSLDQLRSIFTGDLDLLRSQFNSNQSWQAFNRGNLTNFYLYAPNDDQNAVELFQRKVLQENDVIQKFDQITEPTLTRLKVNQMLGAILQKFESPQPAIGMGFARLSKVLGQCSVYPLAIGTTRQEVQAIAQDGNTPITPDTDLCNAKGSYWANTNVFLDGSYPLIEPLTVLYYRAEPNSSAEQAAQAFIKAMKTVEGQCLLSEAGLVPVDPVGDKRTCRALEQ